MSSNNAEEERRLTIKLGNYLAVGTMVWIVRPEQQEIEVFEVATPTKVYSQKDSIKLDTVLPNLEIKIRDIFKSQADENEKSES